MLRNSFRVLVAVSAVAVLNAAQQAQAGWHHHHHYRGYYGYGSSGSSGGSSGGSWGSSGGWAYGSWGSSGGSWGSSGGSWGSSGGSWGSSGGSHGSSGGGYKVMSPAAPATPGAPSATPPATPPGPSDAPPASPAPGNTTYHPTYGPMRNSALLSVKVAPDAQVFVNDHQTTSTGEDREFISRDLQAGAHYNYEVRVETMVDGKPVVDTKSIQLTAGQTAALDFTGSEPTLLSSEPTRTTLTVRLPADAKLFLAGHEMKATGPVREFSTTRLAGGSEWTTYAIRAVIDQDGKQQVREQSIALKAGDSRVVDINFDADNSEKVAETASR